MSFNTGAKHFILNTTSQYPVTFRDTSGTEVTTIADILSDAQHLEIYSFGKFKLSDIKNVYALRGSDELFHTKELRSGDMTVTAPAAGFENVYFAFKFRDLGYSSTMMRDLRQFGVEKRYQVPVRPADTEGTVTAKLFSIIQFEKLRYPSPNDRPLNTVIASGATVTGTYVDGTAFTVVLTGDYDVSFAAAGLAQPVDKITSITAGAGDATLRFTAKGNQADFKVEVQGEDYADVPDSVFAEFATVNRSFEGRTTGKRLTYDVVLNTSENTMPWFAMYNNQQAHLDCLYTNIHFDVEIDRSIQGGLSAVNAKQVSVLSFNLYIKEDVENLDPATGVITQLLTFVGKDGKLKDGYNFFNSAYSKPGEATGNVVIADNTTAWDDAVSSGVKRTTDAQLAGVAGDVQVFIS